jgi:hypothetical protein
MGELAIGVVVCFGFFIVAVLAAVVLGIRDYSERQAYQASRPLEDRIRDFEESAVVMIKNFERVMATVDTHKRNIEWIPPAIDLYRRMQQIAASPKSTTDEARLLADDACQFDQVHRVRGISLGAESTQLADLIARRNQPPGPSLINHA